MKVLCIASDYNRNRVTCGNWYEVVNLPIVGYDNRCFLGKTTSNYCIRDNKNELTWVFKDFFKTDAVVREEALNKLGI